MKALIVYDSFFGNTEQVARTMGQALEPKMDVDVLPITEVKPEQLTDLQLLIVGSPTRAFSPSPDTKQFLKNVPKQALSGVKVTAFDTRISVEDTGSAILSFFVKIFGYAAKPIADRLQKKGGELAKPPEGFYVADTEGPMKEGELERAAQWAAELANGA